MRTRDESMAARDERPIEDDLAESDTLAPDFETFYASTYPAVVRLTFVLTGRLATAEELAQEAFVAAFDRWNTVGRMDQPGAWVRRVATNRAISAWRRLRGEAAVARRLWNERTPAMLIPERDEEVWEAVRKLPRRQSQVVALIVVEDRTTREVADILGCSEDSVRTHLRRARITLTGRLIGGTRDDDDA